MRALARLAVIAALGVGVGSAAACGGKVLPDDGTSKTSSGGPSDATTSTSVGPSPTETTLPTATPTTTTTSVGGNEAYYAQAYFGGLDRIHISKIDLDRDDCVRVVLVSPSKTSAFPNTLLPQTWSVESAVHAADTKSCLSTSAIPNASPVDDLAGSVTFPAGSTQSTIPCTIDLELKAAYGGDTVLLDSKGLVVEGC